MSAIVILLIAIAVFVIAYVTYGSWLAKEWGVDPSRPTPAHTMEDGVDYMPAKSPVLMGHHFASIAGAGPINGPIQAAFFGWVPVLLWIMIGGIFFGAVQDFSSILVSVRHDGRSLGEVIEANIGHRCKMLFTVFAWLVLILVIAAFGDIVASSFASDGTAATLANGSVATASILFIPLAMIFGFLVYRRNMPLLVSTIVGVIVLAACVAIGLAFPITLPKTFWFVFVFIYIAVASVTPVWILLQPRDYLSSFLLYFMIIAAVVGIFGSNPTINPENLPAFSGFVVSGKSMFPVLFITIACGAISGFHSLIGSGTTSKQLDNEKDAKMIGYGGMLIECVLAVISLIAISSYVNGIEGANAFNVIYGGTEGVNKVSPTVVFSSGIASMFQKIGFGNKVVDATKTVIALAVSAFCLTSLDTGTRLGRFMFQELFASKNENANPVQKSLSNMYVATAVTVVFGGVLCLSGYTNIWPLFGACNQLVAVPAFLAAAVWLARSGRNNKMLYFPMIFMLAATLTSLVISFKDNLAKFSAGTASFAKEGLQCIIIVPIFVLAIMLVIEGGKVLIACEKSRKKN